MTVWVLVVWFGYTTTQSSFAVGNIASEAECHRLGDVLKKGKLGPNVACVPYEAATEKKP
jgi:hypothetical protein